MVPCLEHFFPVVKSQGVQVFSLKQKFTPAGHCIISFNMENLNNSGTLVELKIGIAFADSGSQRVLPSVVSQFKINLQPRQTRKISTELVIPDELKDFLPPSAAEIALYTGSRVSVSRRYVPKRLTNIQKPFIEIVHVTRNQ